MSATAMRISVKHVTRYRYAHDASYSIQSLRLTPCEFDGQRVSEWRLDCKPAEKMCAARDAFGNLVHLVAIATPHREIEIISQGTVEVENRSGVVRGLADPMPLRVCLRRTSLTSPTAAIRELLTTTTADDPDRIAQLHGLMHRIRDRVDYLPGVTSFATTADEALTAGQGVCQDHAHIFISAAREAAIPARYVTGYLLLEGQEVADAHHAWAEAWVEGLGWLAFDVANRICPTDRYIRIGAGLDAQYATPIRGSNRGGVGETLEVEVRVAQSMSQQ
jgi:transglutaminase-like putative cysteine protease